MSVNKLQPLNWVGDTIVEVLIVVIVIGTVLTSAYAIAISSLQSMQLVQERGYALKLAEGQLENLKPAVIKDPTLFSTANGFCLNGTTATVLSGGSPSITLDTETYANYPQNCQKDPNGGTCSGFCYHYGLKSAGNNNFTATVRWDGPTGQRQQVQLSYRLYP